MGTTTGRSRLARGAVTASIVVVTLLATSGCTLYGWGSGHLGKLGNGFDVDRYDPTPVAQNPGWDQVAAGSLTSCAIDESAALFCWGSNSNGALGIGTFGGRADTPTRVGTWNDWTQVTVGHLNACGIRTGSALYCWGWNGHGQLGDGTTTTRSTPTAVAGTGWTHVSASTYHACGLRSGEAHCWGSNGSGALGIGFLPDSPAPKQVGVASDWLTLDAGGDNTCGVRQPGALYCWGDNGDGQIGDGTATTRLVPMAVGTGANWMAVSTGDHTCGIRRVVGTQAGRLWCWGRNVAGAVGDGTQTNRSTPVTVGAETDWRTISTGYDLSCGIRAVWLAYCWGTNESGQVGTGFTTQQLVLTPFKLPGDNWALVVAGTDHVLGNRYTPG